MSDIVDEIDQLNLTTAKDFRKFARGKDPQEVILAAIMYHRNKGLQINRATVPFFIARQLNVSWPVDDHFYDALAVYKVWLMYNFRASRRELAGSLVRRLDQEPPSTDHLCTPTRLNEFSSYRRHTLTFPRCLLTDKRRKLFIDATHQWVRSQPYPADDHARIDWCKEFYGIRNSSRSVTRQMLARSDVGFNWEKHLANPSDQYTGTDNNRKRCTPQMHEALPHVILDMLDYLEAHTETQHADVVVGVSGDLMVYTWEIHYRPCKAVKYARRLKTLLPGQLVSLLEEFAIVDRATSLCLSGNPEQVTHRGRKSLQNDIYQNYMDVVEHAKEQRADAMQSAGSLLKYARELEAVNGTLLHMIRLLLVSSEV